MKKIAILGSTGSIGTQTLDVVRAHSDELEVVALAAGSNKERLKEQIREFHPELVSLSDEKKAQELKEELAGEAVEVVCGMDGLIEVAGIDSADVVVTAVVGMMGILPTMEAIKKGKDIALANKETLVTAGHLIIPMAKEYGVSILPVDSEHSAIFQSISNQRKFLKRIIITASGGPFFGKSREYLANVTPAEALKHPNWNMGAKITIDSATLVNKGLEIIEAMHLFGVSTDDIVPIVHRESIVHSMVEFCDGSVIAQLGVPDMKLPIAYALNYPCRGAAVTKQLDLTQIGKLTFFEIDKDAFPAVELAKRAARSGGVMCAVYNGANEKAVEMFLNGKCKFNEITKIIERAMQKAPRIEKPSLEDIFEADCFARNLEGM